MPKSHGIRRRTRNKLSKKVRSRGISPVSRAIQEFEQGSMVHIVIDPSIHKGMPHPKFHGKTGAVIDKRGRAFIIEVKDGNAIKTVIALPEHLKGQKFVQPVDAELVKLYRNYISSDGDERQLDKFGLLLESVTRSLKDE